MSIEGVGEMTVALEAITDQLVRSGNYKNTIQLTRDLKNMSLCYFLAVEFIDAVCREVMRLVLIFLYSLWQLLQRKKYIPCEQ